VLVLERAGRRFPDGTQALRDISIRVNPGDFIALLGPSGCGKSTLLRLMAGLDQPDAGRILGRPDQIGYVFQDPTLLPWATAAENIRLPLRLRHMPKAASAVLVRQALAQVGLAEFADVRPPSLSGGMRMRVSIARALVQRPPLLLMDEPFAALDEFTRHGLQDELLALTATAGCATVFVTHSAYEAAFLARRILVMSSRPGRIVAELAADLPTSGRRDSAAYHALVARITAAALEARSA